MGTLVGADWVGPLGSDLTHSCSGKDSSAEKRDLVCMTNSNSVTLKEFCLCLNTSFPG